MVSSSQYGGSPKEYIIVAWLLLVFMIMMGLEYFGQIIAFILMKLYEWFMQK